MRPSRRACWARFPTEQVSCSSRPISATQPAHGGARREQPVDVKVGLVEAHHFDLLNVRADDRHHPCGDLPVGGEIGREEDGLRAQAPRSGGGDRGAHAVAASLIAGCRHEPRADRCPRPRQACPEAPDDGAARSIRRTRRRRGGRRAGCCRWTPLESSAGVGRGHKRTLSLTLWLRVSACDSAVGEPPGGHPRREQLPARAHAQLAVDVACVRADGLDAHVQIARDLRVRAALLKACEGLPARARSTVQSRPLAWAVARRQLHATRGEVDRVVHVARLGVLRQARGGAEADELCALDARRSIGEEDEVGWLDVWRSARAPGPDCAASRPRGSPRAVGEPAGLSPTAPAARPRPAARGCGRLRPRRAAPRARRSSKRPRTTVVTLVSLIGSRTHAIGTRAPSGETGITRCYLM